MNKFLLLAAVAAPAMLLATPASALDLYGVARVGTTTNAEAEAYGTTIDLSDGQSLNAGVGARFGNIFAEAGIDRDSADLSLGGLTLDATATTYSGTVGYQIDLGNVEPYAEVGYGYTQADANIAGFLGVEGDGWGYHYGFGARVPLSANLALDVNYRHRESDLSFDYIGDVDLTTDSVRAGVVVDF